MTKIRLQIDWDTDCATPSAYNLPEEKTIEVSLSSEECQLVTSWLDLDALVEYLSDKYGFCINSISFSMEES